MAGTMLGPVWGTASQVVFIALAAIGVPVLANFQGGPSAIFGKTGGYAIGYILTALITALLVRVLGRNSGRSALRWSWAAPPATCWARSGS